jgi:arylsulfatase A-like enzyme
VTNVLLVVWDTCRRDALEPYGAPAGATPAAADLARRGVLAPAAHAAASWTMPSHATMFTGLLPRELGLTQAPGGTPQSCLPAMQAQTERLLPELMRRAGYATRASSANLWVDPRGGFGIGFDEFEAVDPGRGTYMHRDGLGVRLRWMLDGVRARIDDGVGQQRDTALRWVAETGTEPFFWFVNLNECHSPYLPPKPFNDLGPVARAKAADENRRYLRLGEIWRACAGGFDVPPAALERMRHLYARSVTSMDAWLADVLGALDAAGRLEDTLVVLTADHGENLGENGLLAHAFSLDQRLVGVPLIAAGPGAEQLAGLPTLADLPRRLADVVGVEHAYAPHDLAVAQLDPLAPADDPRITALFAQWPDLDPDEIIHRTVTAITAVSDGRYKLTRRGDVERFHDLAADPQELGPGTEEVPADVASRLRTRLAAAAVGAVAPTAPSAEELADVEERMRLLGYL